MSASALILSIIALALAITAHMRFANLEYRLGNEATERRKRDENDLKDVRQKSLSRS